MHAAGIIDGKLVIAGGSCWPAPDRKERLRRVDIYDPVQDDWQCGQDLPIGMDGAAGGVVDGRLLVIGGYDGVSARTEVLSGDGRGRWETVAFMPGGRTLASSAVIDHYVYLCAGTQRPDTLDDDLPTLFRIDANGSGQRASRVKVCRPFPGAARAIQASAASGGALFVFGGALVRDGKVVNSPEVWRYMPKPDSWERLPDAPGAVRGWGAIALKGSHTILLLGGYRDDEPGTPPGFRRTIWAFDTIRSRWSTNGELPLAFGAIPYGLTSSGLLLAAGGEDAPRHRAGSTLRGQIIGAGDKA